MAELRRISSFVVVNDKLNSIKKATSYIEELIKTVYKKPFGADEFLPFFCLVMMEANPLHLESECNFIEDFISEEQRNSVGGYLQTQLHIASNFIVESQSRSLNYK